MMKGTATASFTVVLCSLTAATPAVASLAGNALHFGGDDTVKIPYSADFDDRANITVEFWIQYDSLDNCFILDQLGPAPGETGEWGLLTRETKVQFYYRYPGIETTTGEETVTDGSWHHVAVTKAGKYLDIYVDGQHDVSETFGATTRLNAHLPMYWGSRGNFEQYLQGRMDEIRIWDYKRTAQEVEDSYNRTVDPNSPGLLAYWNFDEDVSEQSVFDLCPLSHHGTLGETSAVAADDPTRIVSTAPIIPEPGTLWLIALGGIVARGRRHR
jgi:hypothetical protein